jgi:bisphosphoglycerate-dependent phosphoglycerate mutase
MANLIILRHGQSGVEPAKSTLPVIRMWNFTEAGIEETKNPARLIKISALMRLIHLY